MHKNTLRKLPMHGMNRISLLLFIIAIIIMVIKLIRRH